MDYKEQQEQEIETLKAIYQEEELEIESEEYPGIKLRVHLNSNQGSTEAEDHDFDISLFIELPENYPDVLPKITVEGLDENFDEERIQRVHSKLEDEANNYIGMVMVFSIVSAMQDEIGSLQQELKQVADMKAAEEKEKKDAVERKKFEGTVVTPESFKVWKEKFDKERKALIEKQEKDREAQLAGKLTGRNLFLKDATLNLSDVALIEQNVEIDESLFDAEDLEGLELDSDED